MRWSTTYDTCGIHGLAPSGLGECNPSTVEALAAPDNGHGQPLTGLARLGGLHFRRLHLRLLTVGPCRSHVKGRLSLAPMGPQPLALEALTKSLSCVGSCGVD